MEAPQGKKHLLTDDTSPAKKQKVEETTPSDNDPRVKRRRELLEAISNERKATARELEAVNVAHENKMIDLKREYDAKVRAIKQEYDAKVEAETQSKMLQTKAIKAKRAPTVAALQDGVDAIDDQLCQCIQGENTFCEGDTKSEKINANGEGKILCIDGIGNDWSKPIMVDVCSSKDATETVSIDLCETLGQKTGHTWKNAYSNFLQNTYWFPPSFSGNSDDTFNTLRSYLVQACISAGFTLIVGQGTLPQKTTGLHPKRFICSRSKRFERNKKSQGRYKTSTARAEPGLGEILCPFSFMVFYDPKTQRWLLPFQQKGCAKHAGHCFGEKISVPVCTKTMDEKVPV